MSDVLAANLQLQCCAVGVLATLRHKAQLTRWSMPGRATLSLSK